MLKQFYLEAKQEKVDETKKPAIVQDNNIICTICQMEFEEGETIIDLDCGKIHLFHGACLKEWFQVKISCPTCRADVKEMYKGRIWYLKILM